MANSFRGSPNDDLHDESNDSAPELLTTTGFILSGGAGTPTVQMTQLAVRNLFSSPAPVSVAFPVHSDDTTAITTTFTLVRSEADVVPSIVTSGNGAIPVLDPIQMATASEISIVGHDNVQDTLMIDSSGGPVHVPINFFGGFQTDALVFNGSGIEIDLTDQDEIVEVELIDIGGAGANQLILDVDAVNANDPFTGTLQVLGDSDDTLTIDAGWIFDGSESATLLVAADVSVLVDLPGSDGMASVTSAATVAAVAPTSTGRVNVESEAGAFNMTWAPPPAKGVTSSSHEEGGSHQVITAADQFRVDPEQLLSVSVDYATDSLATTPGLHLRMHFDSSKLTLNILNDILLPSFLAGDLQSEPDCGGAVCGGFDADPDTDRYVNLLWFDSAGNWPSVLPTGLFTANFTVSETFTGQTQINFSGNSAADFLLIAPTIEVSQQPTGDMDVDGDLDFDDIDDFVFALMDPVTYESMYGVPPTLHGDLDVDGDLDFDDIDDFVSLLSAGLHGDSRAAAESNLLGGQVSGQLAKSTNDLELGGWITVAAKFANVRNQEESLHPARDVPQTNADEQAVDNVFYTFSARTSNDFATSSKQNSLQRTHRANHVDRWRPTDEVHASVWSEEQDWLRAKRTH